MCAASLCARAFSFAPKEVVVRFGSVEWLPAAVAKVLLARGARHLVTPTVVRDRLVTPGARDRRCFDEVLRCLVDRRPAGLARCPS